MAIGFTGVLSNPGRAPKPPGVLDTAIAGAKKFKTELGLPSFQDLLGKIGQGGSTVEYGNAGAAGTGAQFARGEIDRFRGDLAGQQAQLAARRRDIANPTGTAGFQNVMRLTNERLGRASEDADRRASEAASRRGYVGGYDPGQTEQARMEALATAGYETADRERAAQREQFASEADLYKAGLSGYNTAMGSYTDLTKTLAELPTKYLDSYARLLSGAGGDFGSIFGTALRGAEFDSGRDFDLLQRKYDLEQQGLDAAETRRRQAGAYDFAFDQSHESDQERLERQRAEIDLEKASRGTSLFAPTRRTSFAY